MQSPRFLAPPVKIFCDLDGVLCDFNRGVERILREPLTDNTSAKRLWSAVSRDPNFFRNLEWTPDGKVLWEAIAPLRPAILTGVPNNNTDVVGRHKAEWCERELLYVYQNASINHIDMTAHKPQRHQCVSGAMREEEGIVNVISCWSRYKHMECASQGTMILIDDRERARPDWEAAGGIFVHHTSSEDSLRQLRELGILDEHNQPARMS